MILGPLNHKAIEQPLKQPLKQHQNIIEPKNTPLKTIENH